MKFLLPVAWHALMIREKLFPAAKNNTPGAVVFTLTHPPPASFGHPPRRSHEDGSGSRTAPGSPQLYRPSPVVTSLPHHQVRFNHIYNRPFGSVPVMALGPLPIESVRPFYVICGAGAVGIDQIGNGPQEQFQSKITERAT